MLFYYPNSRPTLVPPDPNNPLNPTADYINSLETGGTFTHGEFKWNGSNTTVHTDDYSFWNRKGERLCYTPHPELLKELKRFPRNSILNGELMHRATKNVKDLLILHSVMAWNSIILRGKTWSDARDILEGLAWLPRTSGTQLEYGCHILLAEGHHPDPVHPGVYWRMFQQALKCDASIEGVVLKNPNGKLIFSTKPVNDVPWMLKIRKPSGRYNY